MKTVNMPSRFDSGSVQEFLSQFFNSEGRLVSSEFHINFSALGFVTPTGVTVLVNMIEWLRSKNVALQFVDVGHSRSGDCGCKYLDDSGFFRMYLTHPLSELAKRRDTTTPIELVQYERYNAWLDRIVLPWLDVRLGVETARQLPEFKVCLDEVFNNINDHSGLKIGCAFAQHFPRWDEVHFAISDFGVGIPYHVQRAEPHLSTQDALKRATDEGFSTKSTPRNRGAGLDTLIANVAINNKGRLNIHSHAARLYCFTSDTGELVKQAVAVPYYYPGTLIEIVLKTNNIPTLAEIEEEFEW